MQFPAPRIIFGNMAKKANIVTRVEKLSKEGEAMDEAFRKATKKASKKAFSLRKTVLTEKAGWLVYINSKGVVIRKVRKLELPQRRA